MQCAKFDSTGSYHMAIRAIKHCICGGAEWVGGRRAPQQIKDVFLRQRGGRRAPQTHIQHPAMDFGFSVRPDDCDSSSGTRDGCIPEPSPRHSYTSPIPKQAAGGTRTPSVSRAKVLGCLIHRYA